MPTRRNSIRTLILLFSVSAVLFIPGGVPVAEAELVIEPVPFVFEDFEDGVIDPPLQIGGVSLPELTREFAINGDVSLRIEHASIPHDIDLPEPEDGPTRLHFSAPFDLSLVDPFQGQEFLLIRVIGAEEIPDDLAAVHLRRKGRNLEIAVSALKHPQLPPEFSGWFPIPKTVLMAPIEIDLSFQAAPNGTLAQGSVQLEVRQDGMPLLLVALINLDNGFPIKEVDVGILEPTDPAFVRGFVVVDDVTLGSR